MLCLTDRAAIGAALRDLTLDVDLRALIGLRVWDLYVEHHRPPDQGVRFYAVQGGDTADVINAALGMRITGDQAEDTGFDWIEDHGLWFEIAYPPKDGAPTHVFVENGPAMELGIHCLTLGHFWPDA